MRLGIRQDIVFTLNYFLGPFVGSQVHKTRHVKPMPKLRWFSWGHITFKSAFTRVSAYRGQNQFLTDLNTNDDNLCIFCSVQKARVLGHTNSRVVASSPAPQRQFSSLLLIHAEWRTHDFATWRSWGWGWRATREFACPKTPAIIVWQRLTENEKYSFRYFFTKSCENAFICM